MAIATAVLSAYLPYRAARTVSPAAVLVLSLLALVGVLALLQRRAIWTRGDAIGFAATVLGVFAWCERLAWPELLPVGGGPDLTHHLVLINYIERHWRLVYDPALVPYLGDMIFYTPGSHLLIALAGAWTRSDGLHAVHSVLAATVAIKAGFVYCIARRLMRRAHVAFALVAVLLLFVPYPYFLGAFVHDSFWAQVVSELFACAMWWALVVWDLEPGPGLHPERTGPLVVFGVTGAAAFVTWPIWIGPPAIAFAICVWFHGPPEGGHYVRTRQLVAALGPIAAFVVIHTAGRLRWLAIAGTSGAVIRPTPDVVGWPFLILASLGVVVMVARREGRATVALLAAIAVQALALAAVAKWRGADTPYLALKMIFFAIYPLAVAAAVALHAAWTIVVGSPARDRWAWTIVAAVALLAGRRIAAAPHRRAVVTESVNLAGRWARANVPPACVDYLVADGYTGYWLHLAVLDNPRNTRRVEDPDTFEPAKAVERWIEPAGLRYAIVDDVSGFSKALFNGTRELARFGPSSVIERTAGSRCEP